MKGRTGPSILVSFDIDGTLEVGDPPGPVMLRHVQEARSRGAIVGSASDRTRRDQEELWEQHGIAVEFVGHKHHLESLRTRFDCDRLVHIGDTLVDRHYALQAGFEFWWVTELPPEGSSGWIY
jgi:phosphoglycolate phosphatase-like HAD superfamily hydrolase